LITKPTEEKITVNAGFASGGVTCKLGAFCFASSVVLGLKSSDSNSVVSKLLIYNGMQGKWSIIQLKEK